MCVFVRVRDSLGVCTHDHCVMIDYLARQCHKTYSGCSVCVCVSVFVRLSSHGQRCHLESAWGPGRNWFDLSYVTQDAFQHVLF